MRFKMVFCTNEIAFEWMLVEAFDEDADLFILYKLHLSPFI